MVCSGITDNGIRPSIWMAIALLFLPFPRNPSSRLQRARFINIYWFAFLMLILSYVMAGFWKIGLGGIYQLFFDNWGIWNFQALTYVISEYLVKTGNKSWGALWVADHPLFGWPPYLFAIYLESTIFMVFFRPFLWKLYAFFILCMHIGTKLTLDIGFETQFLLAGLLMMTSPFYVRTTLKQSLAELPGIRFFIDRSGQGVGEGVGRQAKTP